jgi:uncharacterized membrane protein YjjP (DUF1212 family)
MHPVGMAVEAALLVMRNGGSTVAADRTFANILKGCHQEGVAAVWRLDFIATTQAVEGSSSTVLRPVGPVKVNLIRASEVAALGERVAQGTVAVAGLEAEVERIKRLPSPYSRWVMIVTAAATAACYSRILGGDWGSFCIVGAAAGIGQLLRSFLYPGKLTAAPVTLICGVLSAMVAGVGLRLGFSQVEPATLIASVIYMVPGLALINGFVDVLSHRHLLVGIERILDAAILFVILAIAIAFSHAVLL